MLLSKAKMGVGVRFPGVRSLILMRNASPGGWRLRRVRTEVFGTRRSALTPKLAKIRGARPISSISGNLGSTPL